MSGARSLVVLGAADGSLSTYRAAAAMGLRTIAVDRSAALAGRADLAVRARGLRFPVVVKPADTQRGRGVSRCAFPGDVRAAAEEARRSSYGGLVMVEEEIRGILCNCECVVDDGRVAFVATSLQTVSPPPLVLTMSRRMPAGLPGGVLDTTRSIMDPVRAAVQAAVGLPIELRPHPPRPVLWQVLTAGRAGELVSVSGAAAARALPGVAELVLLARPGQRVRPYRDVSDRLGRFVVHASGPAELDAAAAAVTRALRFEVRADGRL
ncbi:hypothetical protein [Nonomuraea sp. NPDC049684]|uniref:hypothetical protein n=1 Tax=Nonomuraea sp. NPDC049684 TaxID=3364356 RepID=UPI0037A7B05C